MDIFAKRQIDIAKKTLKMNDVMAKVMGGMTKDEAKAILKKYNVKFNESVVDKINKYLTEDYIEDKMAREAKRMKTFSKEKLAAKFKDYEPEEFEEIWNGFIEDGFIVQSSGNTYGKTWKWEG